MMGGGGGARTVSLCKKKDDLYKQLESALAQSHQIYVEAYCRNESCVGREINIRVKDYDGALIVQLEGAGFDCPICGQTLATHHVRTTAEERACDEHAARASVNAQMFERDEKARHPAAGCVIIAASIVTDDRLPPTPIGWFDNNAPTVSSTSDDEDGTVATGESIRSDAWKVLCRVRHNRRQFIEIISSLEQQLRNAREQVASIDVDIATLVSITGELVH